MNFTTAFLDRDGVINRRPVNKRYITRPDEFEILPMVPEAIRLLNEIGCRVVVVTNQRGIALGCYSEDDLAQIHQGLREELRRHDASVDSIYHCPHDNDCTVCRKPAAGMFLQAKRDFPEIDFARSVVIGDHASDLLAGLRLGCTTVFVGDADESTARELAAAHITPDFSCSSLFEAVTGFVLPLRV